MKLTLDYTENKYSWIEFDTYLRCVPVSKCCLF